jgi:hypothetical protein
MTAIYSPQLVFPISHIKSGDFWTNPHTAPTLIDAIRVGRDLAFSALGKRCTNVALQAVQSASVDLHILPDQLQLSDYDEDSILMAEQAEWYAGQNMTVLLQRNMDCYAHIKTLRPDFIIMNLEVCSILCTV